MASGVLLWTLSIGVLDPLLIAAYERGINNCLSKLLIGVYGHSKHITLYCFYENFFPHNVLRSVFCLCLSSLQATQNGVDKALLLHCTSGDLVSAEDVGFREVCIFAML